jgi:hypothetical protein
MLRIFPRAATRSFATRPIFASFTVYKPESALQVAPIRPTLAPAGSGLSVERIGTVLLSIAAPRGSEPQHGYDWQNKQVFALGAVEIGDVLAQMPGHPLTFVHGGGEMQQQQGGSAEGKTLQVHREAQTLKLALSSSASAPPLSISISPGETEVFRSLLQYSLPRLLAWDAAMDGAVDDVAHATSDGNDWAYN